MNCIAPLRVVCPSPEGFVPSDHGMVRGAPCFLHFLDFNYLYSFPEISQSLDSGGDAETSRLHLFMVFHTSRFFFFFFNLTLNTDTHKLFLIEVFHAASEQYTLSFSIWWHRKWCLIRHWELVVLLLWLTRKAECCCNFLQNMFFRRLVFDRVGERKKNNNKALDLSLVVFSVSCQTHETSWAEH